MRGDGRRLVTKVIWQTGRVPQNRKKEKTNITRVMQRLATMLQEWLLICTIAYHSRLARQNMMAAHVTLLLPCVC